MKKVILFLVLSLTLFAVIGLVGCGGSSTTPPTESENNFYGFWVNEDTDTQSITKIDIQKVGDIICVHIWGKCHPTDCDWGIETTDISEELILLSDGRLKVITFCHFTDNSGRLDYESTEYFIKEY